MEIICVNDIFFFDLKNDVIRLIIICKIFKLLYCIIKIFFIIEEIFSFNEY